MEPAIGILGAGQMGLALGRGWTASGHCVYLGSRDVARAAELAENLGPKACGTSYREAVSSADVIVLTIPPHAVLDVVRELAELLHDKILLDCSASEAPVAWEERNARASLAEQVAQCAPGARVIKALTTVPSSTVAGEERPTVRTVYCGDDDAAKSTVRRLLQELQFDPVDAGALSEARVYEYHASHAVWNASSV